MCDCGLFILYVLFSLNVVLLVSDDVAKFEVRGALGLKAGREHSASLSQNQLSGEDRTKLKVSCDDQVEQISIRGEMV